MKKLMSLIIILLLLAVVWGGANWFIGQKTEQLVKDYLAVLNETYAKQGLQMNLLEYDKTFSGANVIANITLTEDSPFASVPSISLLTEIRMKNVVQNGPILWGEQGITLGLSRWRTTIDFSAIESLELRAMLKNLFQDQEPVISWTDIYFDGSAKSVAKMNPLAYEEDNKRISVAGVDMTSKQTNLMDNPFAGIFTGTVGKIEVQGGESRFTIPSMEMQGNITGIVASSVLGDINFQAQDISILNAGETEPVMFNVDLNSSTKEENENIAGTFHLNVKEIKGVQDQVKNVSYQLTFSDINVAGLEALNQLQMQMQDIQAQIILNNEKTELPEGQKKMMELFTQVQDLTNQMIETVFTKALIRDKSRIHQVLNLDNSKGRVVADADLTYAGSDSVPNMDSIATYGADQWAALFKGDIKIHADKALLPPMATMMLAEPLASNAVAETEDQYHIALRLQGDTVDLNGDVMTFSEMVAKFIPQGGQANSPKGNDAIDRGADLELPEDIMQQIEENGFTPEVIQLIEESDDISQEAKAILKQLQQMEAAGLIAAEKDMPKDDSDDETEETTTEEAQ